MPSEFPVPKHQDPYRIPEHVMDCGTSWDVSLGSLTSNQCTEGDVFWAELLEFNLGATLG